MASDMLHEDPETLGAEAIDRHRAIASLMEELEAIDWYDQRVLATTDDELRAILVHNRDEEKEHATMLLEWLRRQDAALATELAAHLFKAGLIGDDATTAAVASSSDGTLGIGSLRSVR